MRRTLSRLAPTLNLANAALLCPLAALFPGLRRALMHDVLNGCRGVFPHTHPQRCMMVMCGARLMVQLLHRSADTNALDERTTQQLQLPGEEGADQEAMQPPSLLAGAAHFVTWIDDKALATMPVDERARFDAAWQGLMHSCDCVTVAYSAGAEHPMTLPNQHTMQYTGSGFWLHVRSHDPHAASTAFQHMPPGAQPSHTHQLNKARTLHPPDTSCR